VRVAFERTTSAALDVRAGSAIFTWTVGRLDGCTLGASSGSLRFDACARVETGALEVAGRANAASQVQTVPWFAAGAVGRVGWSPTPRLVVDLEGCLLARATDDRFFFRPATTVYEVPLVGAGAAIGVGADFP
jgi:hypothetical protein